VRALVFLLVTLTSAVVGSVGVTYMYRMSHKLAAHEQPGNKASCRYRQVDTVIVF